MTSEPAPGADGDAIQMALNAMVEARASHFGYDTVAEALVDIFDELRELEREPSTDELGDVLFACVNLGRIMGVDPAAALRDAASRFSRRLEHVLRQSPEGIEHLFPAEVATLWREAKAHERRAED